MNYIITLRNYNTKTRRLKDWEYVMRQDGRLYGYELCSESVHEDINLQKCNTDIGEEMESQIHVLIQQ